MGLSEEDVELLAELAHDRHQDRWPDGSHGVIQPYAEVADVDKEANRDSVRAIPEHLAIMGYGLIPMPPAGRSCYFSPDEIERGARNEHARWERFTRVRGYRYGEQRDDEQRVHPDLVPWEQLTDAAREKDRARIRAIPELVANIGLVPVRRRVGVEPPARFS